MENISICISHLFATSVIYPLMRFPMAWDSVDSGEVFHSRSMEVVMRLPKFFPLASLAAVALAGCQATPTSLPMAEPDPAAECHWSIIPGSLDLNDVATALEKRDFLIRDTDTDLGVVYAEHAERAIYHNADAIRPRVGIGIGVGRGVSVGSGVGVGFGGWGWGMDDATRIERVSVALSDSEVRVSRDIRLFDWNGDLREFRSASDANFCVALRQDMTPMNSSGSSMDNTGEAP